MDFFHLVFFFNDTATTEIYTLSLHDALPISDARELIAVLLRRAGAEVTAAGSTSEALDALGRSAPDVDRKSTRLNSSHANISYAVFCLKKKKKHILI